MGNFICRILDNLLFRSIINSKQGEKDEEEKNQPKLQPLLVEAPIIPVPEENQNLRQISPHPIEEDYEYNALGLDPRENMRHFMRQFEDEECHRGQYHQGFFDNQLNPVHHQEEENPKFLEDSNAEKENQKKRKKNNKGKIKEHKLSKEKYTEEISKSLKN